MRTHTHRRGAEGAGLTLVRGRLGLVVDHDRHVVDELPQGFGDLVERVRDKLERDPAVSSSVFVTFVTDFMGFLSFLGLAGLILL